MKKNKEVKLELSDQMFNLIQKARESDGAKSGFGINPSQDQFINGVIYYWVRKNAQELEDLAKKVPEVLEHKSLKITK
tara:strand:- start:429 stop:662 length:234 start_codon:yes stop_codon:yes gene_type:complete